MPSQYTKGEGLTLLNNDDASRIVSLSKNTSEFMCSAPSNVEPNSGDSLLVSLEGTDRQRKLAIKSLQDGVTLLSTRLPITWHFPRLFVLPPGKTYGPRAGVVYSLGSKLSVSILSGKGKWKFLNAQDVGGTYKISNIATGNVSNGAVYLSILLADQRYIYFEFTG